MQYWPLEECANSSNSREGPQPEELWKILVETVHALPMYKNHKRYVEEVLLKEKPEMGSKELAIQINVPLGEAMVLLSEIRGDAQPAKSGKSTNEGPRPADRSLLDFG